MPLSRTAIVMLSAAPALMSQARGTSIRSKFHWRAAYSGSFGRAFVRRT
jgi:hypothetical protein